MNRVSSAVCSIVLCSAFTVSLSDQVRRKTDLLKQVDDKMVEVNTKNHELK